MIARITIIAINFWIGVPYTMLTVSGILMNIPKELYEAAKVDGQQITELFSLRLPCHMCCSLQGQP